MFAIGLALRYLVAYKDEGTYDQVEKKKVILVSEDKTSSLATASHFDSGQKDESSQIETEPSETEHAHEKSIASVQAKEVTDNYLLSRTKEFSEVTWKDSSVHGLRTKVLRRRTVSEGHGCNESSDDNLQSEEVSISRTSPSRREYKERSLEECKTIFKQSVCINKNYSIDLLLLLIINYFDLVYYLL